MQRNQNQINAANAMKKAWQIAKDAAAETGKKASLFFRSALVIAWAEIKNTTKLPELKGSPKQIQWANDLRPKMLEQVAQAEKELNTNVEQYKDVLTDDNRDEINGIRKVFEAIRNAQSASTIIDLRHYNLSELSNYTRGRLLDNYLKAGYIK